MESFYIISSEHIYVHTGQNNNPKPQQVHGNCMEVFGSLVELSETFPVKTKPLKDHVLVESGNSEGRTTIKFKMSAIFLRSSHTAILVPNRLGVSIGIWRCRGTFGRPALVGLLFVRWRWWAVCVGWFGRCTDSLTFSLGYAGDLSHR